jgi:hypothetical protein
MASRRSSWAQAIGLARERGSKIEQGLQHSHMAVCGLAEPAASACRLVRPRHPGGSTPRRGRCRASEPGPVSPPVDVRGARDDTRHGNDDSGRPTDGHPGENAQVLVKRALADRARKRYDESGRRTPFAYSAL